MQMEALIKVKLEVKWPYGARDVHKNRNKGMESDNVVNEPEP